MLGAMPGTISRTSDVLDVVGAAVARARPGALLAAKGVQGPLEGELGEALDGLPPDLGAAAIALLTQMVTSAGTRHVAEKVEQIAMAKIMKGVHW